MLEALWSVQFATPQGMAGGGVVVFETGRIFGGDTSFFYVGAYDKVKDDGILNANVRVSRHAPGLQSVFGLEDFELTLSGKIGAKNFDVIGSLVADPRQQLNVHLKHIADLP